MMNAKLQQLLDSIQQSAHLSDEEKNVILKSAKEVDKEIEIINFKLDRTEKVKKTTAILLEETIEELEQKRKAVEAQNRELEIEKALEKVRSAALAMKELPDMIDVCHIISEQLESLGVKEIRNVQTAIFYVDKGTYVNYEFYRLHDKSLITEVEYLTHPVSLDFAQRMLKGPGELFNRSLEGDALKEWYAFQQTTNQFADTHLAVANSLNYYWYSIGPVALGMSTYAPLKEEELNLFKRFRNVFELAYRRFLDIEKAIAQAKEARLETALERVRAVAMAMRKPQDLSGISETLFTELKALDFNGLRNTEIIINNDSKETITSYYYSDYGRTGVVEVDYKTNPTVQDWVNQLRKADDAFVEVVIHEKEMEVWRVYMEEIGYKPDTKLDGVKAIYYYSYSIGLGAMSISSFTAIAAEQIKILERFRNVFNLSYQRYADIALAEAQAREAKIEAALERTRTQSMIMQHSKELDDTLRVFHEQVQLLGINSAFSFLWLPNEEKDEHIFWAIWEEGNDDSRVFKNKASPDCN